MCDDILRRTSIRTEVTDEHLSRRTGWQQFFRCMFVYLLIHVPFFSWFTGHKKTLVQVVYFRFGKCRSLERETSHLPTGCKFVAIRWRICLIIRDRRITPSASSLLKMKASRKGKKYRFSFFILPCGQTISRQCACYHWSPMTLPNLIPAPPFISMGIMAAFVGQGTWASPVIPRRFR